ncbi:MAG: lipid-A-disaccharide synthase [Armatimonadota bacterium]|jgi:lipid-A-disaccharide synthase
MGKVPRIFVVAGEPSADKHGALLGEALRAQREVHLAGVGQSRMRDAGFELLFDSTGWSGIGVIDSLRRVPGLMVRMRQLSSHLIARPPDLLVLIDFGAFNVRLARRIRAAVDCPVFYYFPPRSWSRDADYMGLAGLVDRVATPFPWSERRLREAGIEAVWVGHPVVDRIGPLSPEDRADRRAKLGIEDGQIALGLLPGSREMEIRCNGPQMLGAAAAVAGELGNVQVLLSVAPGVSRDRLARQVAGFGLADRTRLVAGVAEIVQAADLAIVTSGTATLETAAAACPMLIVYRGTWLMSLEKRLRRFVVPFVGMPNIIADEEIVPELIDQNGVAPRIADTALGLLRDEARMSEMRGRLLEVREQLGSPGVSERVAGMALDLIPS